MCNDFGNNIPYSAYIAAFGEAGIAVGFPQAAPNLEPRDNIWPSDKAPVIRQTDNGHEFIQLRWGFAPPKPKARSVINFRSEGRRFNSQRCLIPASHFFEFTGAKAPKSKWKFTKTDEEWFCFAGIWKRGTQDEGDAFTILTTSPGPDVTPIHDRQVVVLNRDDWSSWLDKTKPEEDMLRALPAGSLAVEQVR